MQTEYERFNMPEFIRAVNARLEDVADTKSWCSFIGYEFDAPEHHRAHEGMIEAVVVMDFLDGRRP